MTAINVNGAADVIPSSDGKLTLNIPIQIRRRGGCKRITLPNGETGTPHKPLAPTAMQLALARGHRWLAMLESGEAKTMRELAAREGVDNSYVSRMINMTLLPPWTIAAILDDSLPDDAILFDMVVDPPLAW
ncbi:MAG: LacI family transcriptional regulator [Nitrosomonadales bacterium]|nr:LacI family transcriptional regulator [Nitrosomonadales bacterium]